MQLGLPHTVLPDVGRSLRSSDKAWSQRDPRMFTQGFLVAEEKDVPIRCAQPQPASQAVVTEELHPPRRGRNGVPSHMQDGPRLLCAGWEVQ